MAYSEVTAFSRMEICEENLSQLNQLYPSGYTTRCLVICITPVNDDGEFVDISDKLLTLIAGGQLKFINYFGGADFIHEWVAFSIDKDKTILAQDTYFIYITLETSDNGHYSFGNISPCFVLDDGTLVSSSYNSGYGFDSQVVFYLPAT